MAFNPKSYSNKVSAEEHITAHILKEINKRFKNIASLEEFETVSGYFVVPYRVKDSVDALLELLNQNKFLKSRLYEEYSTVSRYGNAILVFQFLRRELYCLVPFSDIYLDGTNVVVCFGREACLLRFKDFLIYLAEAYGQKSSS